MHIIYWQEKVKGLVLKTILKHVLGLWLADLKYWFVLLISESCFSFKMDIGTKLAENVIFAFYLHKYVICVFFIATQFPIEKFIFDSESARNRVFLFFPTIACQMCT